MVFQYITKHILILNTNVEIASCVLQNDYEQRMPFLLSIRIVDT